MPADSPAPGFYVVPGDKPLAHYFRGGASLCGAAKYAPDLERWHCANPGPVPRKPAASPVCEACQRLNDVFWAGKAAKESAK